MCNKVCMVCITRLALQVCTCRASAAAVTWYRASLPPLNETVMATRLSLNLTGFGRGEMFLNGAHVTHYDLEVSEP